MSRRPQETRRTIRRNGFKVPRKSGRQIKGTSNESWKDELRAARELYLKMLPKFRDFHPSSNKDEIRMSSRQPVHPSEDFVSGSQPADPARAIANDRDDWLADGIFIPVSERGRSLRTLTVSVRLSNVFGQQELHLLGDLHGKTYREIGRYRNCGRKTLEELRNLVRQIQLGNSQHPIATDRADWNPNIVSVSTTVRSLLLKELPMSKRLENVLLNGGFTTVGDLDGYELRDLWRAQNCGKKTIFELKELLRRAEAGEFTPVPSTSSSDPLTTVIRFVRAGMRGVNERNREIVRQRLFGRNGEPQILEDVGERFGMTRERVRQIVKGAFQKVKSAGGPVLARALEALANEHNGSVVPVTAPLVAERLSTTNESSEWPELFYVHVIDRIAPFIPVWGPDGGREALGELEFGEINSALEEWLRSQGAHPTAKEAFEHLRTKSKFDRLAVAAFFSALRRSRNIIVDFPRADEPRLRLRRLRLFDIVLPVLLSSTEPLTPEKIIQQARSRFSADAIMLSERTAENALAAHPEVFRLGPRSFGLRQHFVSSPADWPRLRDQFIQLLRKENRPISTIEICDKHSIALPSGINSYELAEILREDPRLIDLGRRLFALTKWGVEEREHVKDLLPRILAQADRPLTLSEIYQRLTKLRSAALPGLSNVLFNHPKITRFGFEHYGLRAWGNSRNAFVVNKRSIVERVVRRADPPITFGELCGIFRIPIKGSAARVLWRTCAGSRKLRRAPDRQGADTLLMHRAVSLEQALASIARTLARPAQAYELEWEVSSKFGELFGNIRLQRIEERLNNSPLFLRNAEGAFFLDADFDHGEFDVDAIRSATSKLMREEWKILSSDDLLERLESQGFDLEGMTRGMLASILRGSEELEEVGRERFRAK